MLELERCRACNGTGTGRLIKYGFGACEPCGACSGLGYEEGRREAGELHRRLLPWIVGGGLLGGALWAWLGR